MLTEQLRSSIDSATTMMELEDIYLPYRPKRRTLATIAKEKGLEPLAKLVLTQEITDPAHEAITFVSMKSSLSQNSIQSGRIVATI